MLVTSLRPPRVFVMLVPSRVVEPRKLRKYTRLPQGFEVGTKGVGVLKKGYTLKRLYGMCGMPIHDCAE